jgi:hypothetical protein
MEDPTPIWPNGFRPMSSLQGGSLSRCSPGLDYTRASPENPSFLNSRFHERQNSPFSFVPFVQHQQRPLPRLIWPADDSNRRPSSARTHFQGNFEERNSRWQTSSSPSIKSEHHSNDIPASSKTFTLPAAVDGGTEVSFGTEVDTLMKAIQTKTGTTKPQDSSPERIGLVASVFATLPYSKRDKKRYECKFKNCRKSFDQKAHLEVHERAHTGMKPYVSPRIDLRRLFN